MVTRAEMQQSITSLERENSALKTLLSRMERELRGKTLPEDMPPNPIPSMILGLMREYKLPWECFWCDKHRDWFVILDSCFPHYWDECECRSCMNADPHGGC